MNTWRTAASDFVTAGYHLVQTLYLTVTGQVQETVTPEKVEKYVKDDNSDVGYLKTTYMGAVMQYTTIDEDITI